MSDPGSFNGAYLRIGYSAIPPEIETHELFDLNPMCGIRSTYHTASHETFMCDTPLSGRYLTVQSVYHWLKFNEIYIYRSGTTVLPQYLLLSVPSHALLWLQFCQRTS